MLSQWHTLAVAGDLSSYHPRDTRFGFPMYADPLDFARAQLTTGLFFLALAGSAAYSYYHDRGWVQHNFALYILAAALPLILEVAWLATHQ